MRNLHIVLDHDVQDHIIVANIVAVTMGVPH
jgi:hypothetical protein